MDQVIERASWRDYLELTKPTVVALMLLTAVIGMFMAAPGMVPWCALVFGNLGIALCAGSAGAAPPLLGWTAVTGEIHGHALLLVLIIFAWTPPHFWALAIHRREE